MKHYDLTVPQLAKMLRNLDRWLTAAGKHAEARKFDVDTLVHARLAPDQFDLRRQVQNACDHAKFICCRLAGRDVPSHADTETTFAQLHARIAAAVALVESFKPDDFAGASERKISLPRWEGKWINGDEYLVQFGLPNFYFHITTAYAILRHNGVEVGKRDFIGELPMHA
jgi:uncharacterized protein